MAITSAQYVKNSRTDENECIKVVRDGKTWFVPLNTDGDINDELQEWVAEGNTIQEAD